MANPVSSEEDSRHCFLALSDMVTTYANTDLDLKSELSLNYAKKLKAKIVANTKQNLADQRSFKRRGQHNKPQKIYIDGHRVPTNATINQIARKNRMATQGNIEGRSKKFRHVASQQLLAQTNSDLLNPGPQHKKQRKHFVITGGQLQRASEEREVKIKVIKKTCATQNVAENIVDMGLADVASPPSLLGDTPITPSTPVPASTIVETQVAQPTTTATTTTTIAQPPLTLTTVQLPIKAQQQPVVITTRSAVAKAYDDTRALRQPLGLLPTPLNMHPYPPPRPAAPPPGTAAAPPLFVAPVPPALPVPVPGVPQLLDGFDARVTHNYVDTLELGTVPFYVHTKQFTYNPSIPNQDSEMRLCPDRSVKLIQSPILYREISCYLLHYKQLLVIFCLLLPVFFDTIAVNLLVALVSAGYNLLPIMLTQTYLVDPSQILLAGGNMITTFMLRWWWIRWALLLFGIYRAFSNLVSYHVCVYSPHAVSCILRDVRDYSSMTMEGCRQIFLRLSALPIKDRNYIAVREGSCRIAMAAIKDLNFLMGDQDIDYQPVERYSHGVIDVMKLACLNLLTMLLMALGVLSACLLSVVPVLRYIGACRGPMFLILPRCVQILGTLRLYVSACSRDCSGGRRRRMLLCFAICSSMLSSIVLLTYLHSKEVGITTR